MSELTDYIDLKLAERMIEQRFFGTWCAVCGQTIPMYVPGCSPDVGEWLHSWVRTHKCELTPGTYIKGVL